MKTIKILTLHMGHDGIEKAVTLVSNMLSKYYKVEVISLYDVGYVAYPLNEQVTLTYLTRTFPHKTLLKNSIKKLRIIQGMKTGMGLLKLRYLKRKLIQQTIENSHEDVLISTRHEFNILLSKYGQKNQLKIAQLHHDHHGDYNILNDVVKHYQNIDILTVLAPKLKTELEQAFINKNTHTKVVYIPNFVENKQEISFLSKDHTILCVGRLEHVKGFERLLDIWEMTTRQLPGWTLKIVGDGSLKRKLNKIITDKNITDSVKLLGMLDTESLNIEYSKASIYTMTSYNEGFGFVIIEAMQYGLPVIAFDVRVGPATIIQDGINGYLIQDGDLKAFVNCLVKLAQDRQKLEELSLNATNRAATFKEEKVSVIWEKLLNH